MLRAPALLVTSLVCGAGCASMLGIQDLSDDGGAPGAGSDGGVLGSGSGGSGSGGGGSGSGSGGSGSGSGGSGSGSGGSGSGATADSGGTESGSSSDGGGSGSGGAIAFVQAAEHNDPNGSDQTVEVTFDSQETAGDLNIVVVGWYDDTPLQAVTVTDSAGNVYRPAGPAAAIDKDSSPSTLAVYYAAGIDAGQATDPTAVTVSWGSATVDQPDVWILEYSGLSASEPLDQVASNTGVGAQASAGPITTKWPNELVFAAGITWAIPGFGDAGSAPDTVRILTKGGNIAQDQIVGEIGAYSAQASQTGSSQVWVFQMATFH
jgi:hypothetical protein